MDIYLKFDKTEIKFPVLPSSFEMSTKQNNTVVNVVTAGEINLTGKRGLKSISFSSFFPASSVHGGYKTRAKFAEPYALCNKIEKAKDTSKICRLLITETNINGEFLIDEFKYGINDGSGDIEFSISFSEYVRPKVTLKISGVTTLASNRTYKAAAKTYTVKSGDTLKSIAKKQLGSSKKFTKIAALNHIAAPYKIKSGQVLVLQ